MTVNMAVTGLGWIGQYEASLYERMEGVSLVCGADTGTAAREAFETAVDAPSLGSHEQLIEEYGSELDAVTIATPHALHFEQARMALKRDISVLVEKPMVTKLSDAHDLVEMEREVDAILSVGYQRRFHNGFSEVKNIVDEGQIGDLHTISCHIGQSWLDLNKDSWRVDENLAGGGQLYDTGSHMLESLLWTCDLRPKMVNGLMRSRGQDVDLDCVLSAEFDRRGSDVLCSITVCGDSTDLYPDEGLVVWGREGRLIYDKDGRLPNAKERLRLVKSDGPAYTAEFERGIDYETLTRRKAEAFVKAVAGESSNEVPGSFGLELSKFRSAARRAWNTGTTVDVEAHYEQEIAQG